MPARLDELDYPQLRAAVAALHERGRIDEVRHVAMAEAEVFLCRSQRRRFNVKFDLAYGALLEPVDEFAPQALARIEQELIAAAVDAV